MTSTFLRIFLLHFLLLPMALRAQYSKEESETIAEAESFFEVGDYYMCHQLISPVVKIHVDSAHLNYLCGVSAFHLHTYRSTCIEYLQKAAEQGYEPAYRPYVRALIDAGKLREASDYLSRLDQHTESLQLRSWISNAYALMNEPVAVQVEPLGISINSEYVEHTPLISLDDSTLYFTSRRPMTESSVTDLNGEYDENIYVSERSKEGWERAEALPGNVNDLLNDATVSLHTKGDRMVIFKTNRDIETSDLWSVRKKNGEWKVDQRLKDPINSKWTENSLTMNSQDNVYYIASDRPGGLGGMDIYRVVVFGNGDLSRPINLGPTINTPYDEIAPFVLPDDRTLYFSSDRPESMGGFDIFQCQLLHDTIWSEPQNLGYPLNTTSDDLHMSVSWKGGTAYFTRSSEHAPGDFDIYRSNLPGFNIRANVYKGKIQNEGVDFPEISLFSDDFSEVMGVYTMSESGDFMVILLPGDSGVLEVMVDGFETYELNVSYKDHEGILEIPLNIELKPTGQ